jgi:hypothetical protein
MIALQDANDLLECLLILDVELLDLRLHRFPLIIGVSRRIVAGSVRDRGSDSEGRLHDQVDKAIERWAYILE